MCVLHPQLWCFGPMQGHVPPELQKGMALAAGCLQDQTLSTEDTSVSSGWRALSRKGGRVTLVGPRMRYQALPFPLVSQTPHKLPGGVRFPLHD